MPTHPWIYLNSYPFVGNMNVLLREELVFQESLSIKKGIPSKEQKYFLGDQDCP